jgi:hypothetical protein
MSRLRRLLISRFVRIGTSARHLVDNAVEHIGWLIRAQWRTMAAYEEKYAR